MALGGVEEMRADGWLVSLGIGTLCDIFSWDQRSCNVLIGTATSVKGAIRATVAIVFRGQTFRDARSLRYNLVYHTHVYINAAAQP